MLYLFIRDAYIHISLLPDIMEGLGGDKVDPELQQFIAMETQKAQFQGQVHRLTDTCWDMCVDRPREKFDYKTETCISNCVGRFIDTSLHITGRFQQMLQKSMQ